MNGPAVQPTQSPGDLDPRQVVYSKYAGPTPAPAPVAVDSSTAGGLPRISPMRRAVSALRQPLPRRTVLLMALLGLPIRVFLWTACSLTPTQAAPLPQPRPSVAQLESRLTDVDPANLTAFATPLTAR